MTINDIILQYKSSCPGMCNEMNAILSDYQKALTIPLGNRVLHIKRVLEECVRGLYTNGHQWCVKKSAVIDAVNNLVTGQFVNKDGIQSSLFDSSFSLNQQFNEFEELYDAIKQLIGSINGIGLVTLYDTAKHIGLLYKDPILPQTNVYLHSSTNKVNKAARALLSRRVGYREPTACFSSFFPSISSPEIEDILCHFSDVLQNYDPLTGQMPDNNSRTLSKSTSKTGSRWKTLFP